MVCTMSVKICVKGNFEGNGVFMKTLFNEKNLKSATIHSAKKSKNRFAADSALLSISVIFMLIFTVLLSGCGTKTLLSENDPVTLEFWHVYGEQSGSPMDDLVDEFNRTTGAEKGICIKVTAVSNATDIGKFLKEAQEGSSSWQNMPDIFTCHINDAAALGDDSVVDWNNWFTADELSDFVPGFLEDGTLNDKLVIFPVSKSTQLLMINGSGFGRFSETTGVTYDDLTTWEGFYDAAAKFYEWSGGETFCAMDYPIRAVELDALERGGSGLYNDDGWYAEDNEIFKESWMRFADALSAGHIVVSDLYSNTQVMTGDTLCGLGSSAAILYYNDTVTYRDGTSEPMDLHILPMPKADGTDGLMTQAGVGLCAYKTTEQKAEAASVFVRWLTEAERNLDFVTRTGYMPVRNGAFDSIKDYDFSDENYERLYAALSIMHDEYTPVSEPRFDGYYDRVSTLYDKLRELQSSLAADSEGTITADTAKKAALSSWELLLDIDISSN